jgi:hypothetical protein
VASKTEFDQVSDFMQESPGDMAQSQEPRAASVHDSKSRSSRSLSLDTPDKRDKFELPKED